MPGIDVRRPFAALTKSIPHEFRAIAEDAMILVLILVAVTLAEGLAVRLLGKHIPPIISGLLTASLWVMCGIYAVSVLSMMRKLIKMRFAPSKDGTMSIMRKGRQQPRASENRRATDQPITVLVVDDDSLASSTVKHVLSLDSRIGAVTTANSPDAAIAKILSGPANEAPDVVLLDVNYAGSEKTGIDALSEIREASPGSKLLIMSVCRTQETVRAALANDADGFIWKNESAVDFAEAVIGTTHDSFVASKSVARDLVGATQEA